MTIAVSPKTVQISEKISSFHVRGSYATGGQLTHFSVLFLNEKGKLLHAALRPSHIRPTAAVIDQINAAPLLPAEIAEGVKGRQAWLDRVTTPWVLSAYGLTAI